jgi:hypothetical protein
MNAIVKASFHARVKWTGLRLWWYREMLAYLADTNPDLSDCGTFARLLNTPCPPGRSGRFKRWRLTAQICAWLASRWLARLKPRRAERGGLN